MPSPPSSACPPSCSTLARATRGGSPRKGVPFRADAHAFLASLCLSCSHLLLVLLLLPLWLLPLRRASSSSGGLSLSHSATSSSTTSLRNSWVLDSKEKLTEEGFNESGVRWVPLGSVLLTSRASIGYVAIAGTQLTTNQGFASF